jgi:hypothetical protein
MAPRFSDYDTWSLYQENTVETTTKEILGTRRQVDGFGRDGL